MRRYYWPILYFYHFFLCLSCFRFLNLLGTKIHASIRKHLLYVFPKKLAERDVYKMSYFSVSPNVGSYRTSVHPYKLIFQMKIKVQKSEGSRIPLNGLLLTRIGELFGHTADYDYLVGETVFISHFFLLMHNCLWC